MLKALDLILKVKQHRTWRSIKIGDHLQIPGFVSIRGGQKFPSKNWFLIMHSV